MITAVAIERGSYDKWGWGEAGGRRSSKGVSGVSLLRQEDNGSHHRGRKEVDAIFTLEKIKTKPRSP